MVDNQFAVHPFVVVFVIDCSEISINIPLLTQLFKSQIFDDALKAPTSVIILDDLEHLIGK